MSILEIHQKQEKLTKQGFKLNSEKQILINELPKENDRFTTVLYVYVDELDLVYINQYKSNGLRTISDGDLLRNHNNCQTSAKEHYVEIMDALPFLSSGLKDTKPSNPMKMGEIRQIPFSADPMFITRRMLQKKYETLVQEDDIKKSTRYALSHVLYTKPLTDEELTTIWEKWKIQHDSKNTTNTISISGKQSQIDQLFQIIYKTERYQTEQKRNYLTGMDYEYAVIDIKCEEIMESDHGNHYMTIINLINKNHSATFYNLPQEEKDAFILSNFDLVGNTYDFKEYYVDSVNESIQWDERRH